MSRLRPLLTIPIGIVVIILAVANRHDVGVVLTPLPWTIDIPLYALILAFFVIGVLTGGLTVWFSRVKKQRKRNQRERDKAQTSARISQTDRTRISG